jgi:Leucine-rich repeat (LRR) protein
MSRQSLPVGSKHVRTFGRHLKHKVNGKTVVYTNEDVTIYDAAYSKNDIEIIPTIILQLFPNLVTMDLRRMNLSSITRGSFQSCDKLKNIYFADDTIKKIEAGVFGNCSNLVSLNFTNNSLPSLNEDAFAGLKKLEVLTLNRNNLKSVSANQFKGLSKLIEITISYQPLYSLPQHIFDDLVKLQILNLNNNLLVNVPGQFFHGKPLLRSVDLRGNHIVAIDRKMMDYLPNRAVVNLLGNVCYNGNLGSIDKFTKVTVEMKCAKCFEKFRQLTAVSSNKTTPNPKSKKAQDHPARKSIETVVHLKKI